VTEIRYNARQLSLSVAGILVLIVVVAPVCVPQEVRKVAASRIMGLAHLVDSSLNDAWRSAGAARGLDRLVGAALKHDGNGTRSIALTAVEASPPTFVGAGPMDIGSFRQDSSNAGDGVGGSASDSMRGLLNDMLREDSQGTGGGLEAFARSFARGGNSRAGSGMDANLYSGDAWFAGGSGSAGVSGSSSTMSSLRAAASEDSANRLGVDDVGPNVHHVHRTRPSGLGKSFMSVYDGARSASKEVASSDSETGLVRDGVADRDWIAGIPNGVFDQTLDSTPADLDPTGGDLVGQLLHCLAGPVQHHHPVQDQDTGTSVVENERDGESSGGDGRRVDSSNPPADPQGDDRGPGDNPLTAPASETGLVSSVPEPQSLSLLSLGLVAIILWRKFGSD